MHWHTGECFEDLVLSPHPEHDGLCVDKAAYELHVRAGQIGYEYISKQSGGQVHTALMLCGNNMPKVPEPIVVGHRIIWHDVAKDMDIFLQIRENGVEWFKVLKSPEAPQTITWSVSRSEAISPENMRMMSEGQDNLGNPLHLLSKAYNAHSKEGWHKSTYVESFLGEVSVIADRDTRRRMWSDQVSYPIIIDVPDVTETSADNKDDVVSLTNATPAYPYGLFDGKLRLTYFYGTKVQVGVRFPTVNVPQGQVIDLAELKLYQISGNDLVTGTWYGDDADTTTQWANSSNLPRDITKTTANAPSVRGSNASYVAQDVTDIVQEIVDRAGWTADNAMSFLCEVTGGSGQDNGIFWNTTGLTPSNPPILEITYGVDPNVTGTITSAMPSLDSTLTGTRTIPVYTGSIEAALPVLDSSLAGTSAVPVYSGTIDGQIPSLDGSLSGSSKTYTGTITSELPPFDSTLTDAVPIYSNAGVAPAWPPAWIAAWGPSDFETNQK